MYTMNYIITMKPCRHCLSNQIPLRSSWNIKIAYLFTSNNGSDRCTCTQNHKNSVFIPQILDVHTYIRIKMFLEQSAVSAN